MASGAGVPLADAVTVPDLTGLPVWTAQDLARRCQLVATTVEPQLDPVDERVVLGQEPKPGTPVPRWSSVSVWTTPDGGGGAGVREPRRPVPPPREVRLHRDEPDPLPQV